MISNKFNGASSVRGMPRIIQNEFLHLSLLYFCTSDKQNQVKLKHMKKVIRPSMMFSTVRSLPRRLVGQHTWVGY